MKKKILVLCLVVVLAAAAVAVAMACLRDTDSGVNVMTLDNVEIEQIERERDANGNLVDFTRDKPLYPAEGEIELDEESTINVSGRDYKMYGDKNAIDRIVTVRNTGECDAYVRTIFAVEDPYDKELLVLNAGSVDDEIISVEIGDVEYTVFSRTYKSALEPNEESRPSLLQVGMESYATDEDVAMLGEIYDILVLSQAVPTGDFEAVEDEEGEVIKTAARVALDTGFGEINEENVAKWFAEIAPGDGE